MDIVRNIITCGAMLFLLIPDNLELILDEYVSEFLQQLKQMGLKIATANGAAATSC